jgi:hypothetical protein
MKKAFPMRDRRSHPSALEATEGERSEPQGAGRALATPESMYSPFWTRPLRPGRNSTRSCE